MWRVYLADGTVHSDHLTEEFARALCRRHPGWYYVCLGCAGCSE